MTAVLTVPAGNATLAPGRDMPTVFGWAADVHGCGYYRMQLPALGLLAQGMHVESSPYIPDDVDRFALIVGQRVVKSDTSQHWQRLAAEGRRLIYELDDDVWSLGEDNSAREFYAKPGVLDLVAENVACASAVTCSTEPLAAVLRRFNPNVHVIPNYIDAALLHMQRPRRPRVTIGWAGSPTHSRDVQAASRALRKLLASRRLVDLHVIGTDYRAQLGRCDARFSHWARHVPDYYRLLDFDIGLAPLQDTEFNRSKSPIKALEYAALGIPVVASNVGPYAEFVQHGVTGFLCDTEADWARYLRLLVGDPQLRRSMGLAARVQAHDWTIQGNAHRWADVFREVVTSCG